MEKMVFKAFNKSQLEDELDENCNIASSNNQNDSQEEKRKSSSFNLLSKFKRRTSTDTNQHHANQQIIIDHLNQQSLNSSLNSQISQSNSSSNKTSSLDRNNSNLSTSSVKSSKISLTKQGLGKKLKTKKDLKQQTSKPKKASSVNGDNLILQSILGKGYLSQSNMPLNEPLNEKQYLKYLHPDGRIKCLRELRLAVYRRGVESSLRSTVWKHLLNVYPSNLTSEQRVRFVQQKADQYYQLCFTWQRNFSHAKVQHIHNQVRKDVLRTDRSHPFYVSKVNLDTEQQNDITSSVSTYSSILTQFDFKTNNSSIQSSFNTNDCYSDTTGIDQQFQNGVYENRNVQALTNILVTYSLNHKIGYWQGMSDLCSPILLAIQNEADAYICFVALMRRLTENFNGDECIANKFDLLRKLVQHYDPTFYDYLEQQQASDLLFCYRWLLLELKREFKLDNALYMLEVSWAAMPPQFYADLPMYNKKFNPLIDEEQNELSESTNKESKLTESIKINDKSIEQNSPTLSESVNSSKTLSNSLSFKNGQDNIKNLRNEMSNAVNQINNQIKRSVNEMISNLNNSYNNSQNSTEQHARSVRQSTLKGLKLSSVEEQLACKREKFQQQNTTGHSISSLNDLEPNATQKTMKNSSLNGSNHSLLEYNNTLNYILNKTQAMLKQQEQKLNRNFSFTGKKSKNDLIKDTPNKETTTRCSKHIRFLPKILSTDSGNDAIDSPEDLNEKLNFSNLMNKQFSIDSVDSLEFNMQQPDTSSSAAKNSPRQQTSSTFNNNFTCFTNFNSLPFNTSQFTSNLPFTKQNSIPSTNLLKQQLKQSINQQQNHLYHFKQRSLPSSPLFRKKLDSFERPFLPFLQNVTNILDKHMFVAGQQMNSSNNMNNMTNKKMPSFNQNASINSKAGQSAQLTRRSKLINNQYDSFDQRELFVHCSGENENRLESSSNYNNNWKPERGLLNCFDSSSFDASSNFNLVNNSSTTDSHQRLSRQLSDKLINEKKHGSSRQASEDNRLENKKLITHTQSINTYQPIHSQLNSKLNNNKIVNVSNSNNASSSSNQHQTIPSQTADLNESAHYLKATTNTSTNSSTHTAYEKEEKSEGYCSGSISDRNSSTTYEEQCTNLENELAFTTTFSNSSTSLKSSKSTSSSSSSIPSSISCSSSLVILSSNASFRARIEQIEKQKEQKANLPSPAELSSGNAFMLFICLTILLLHRDKLMNENLDANEMAIYFDQRVRKHDVDLVLNTARELFASYLNKYQGFQLVEQVDQSVLDSIDGSHQE